jgi:hypothetical protein
MRSQEENGTWEMSCDEKGCSEVLREENISRLNYAANIKFWYVPHLSKKNFQLCEKCFDARRKERALRWIITKDHINCNAEGSFPAFAGKPKDKEKTTAFRLYDDDDNLCFSGKAAFKERHEGFEPLDDFGESFGCTYIKLYELDKTTKTYKWKVL